MTRRAVLRINLKAAEYSFNPLIQKIDDVIASKVDSTLNAISRACKQDQESLGRLAKIFYFDTLHEESLSTENSVREIDSQLALCHALTISVTQHHKEAESILQNTEELKDKQKSSDIFEKTLALRQLVDEVATHQKLLMRAKMLSVMSSKLDLYLQDRKARYPHKACAREDFVSRYKS